MSRVVATILGYMLGYLPGLILNALFLSEARAIERESGVAPDGIRALRALMFVFFWLPLIVVGLVVGTFALLVSLDRRASHSHAKPASPAPVTRAR
jgi:hypothetical protein